MNKTLKTAALVSIALTPSLFAQGADPGALVSGSLGTVLGYSTAIIPAGLAIFAVVFGVRKVKSMGRAAS